jgi:hypothetical protein
LAVSVTCSASLIHIQLSFPHALQLDYEVSDHGDQLTSRQGESSAQHYMLNTCFSKSTSLILPSNFATAFPCQFNGSQTPGTCGVDLAIIPLITKRRNKGHSPS